MEVGLQVFTNEPLVIPARVEHKGQCVLTSEQLAEFYGSSATQIRQNFNNNKERFIEGVHYFKLEGEALKEFKNFVENFDPVNFQIGLRAPILYLWTKRGALHHAKMLNTDRAWEVYEILEDRYFDAINAMPNFISTLKYVINELITTDMERQFIEASTYVLSLKLRAAIEETLADYEKNKHRAELLLMDLPGEIWRDIKGFDGEYQVSTKGRVKSFHYHKIFILKQRLNKKGYYSVALYKNGKSRHYRVNRLVAEAFIPNPENKPLVHHRDDNPSNNCVENLEWVTEEENTRYALAAGRMKTGSAHYRAKFTEEDIRFIRTHYIPRHPIFSAAALAEKYGVYESTIYNILRRKTWKHVV